jgi:hypothetical protein
MSDDYQDLRRFANLRFSQLLKDGFRLFAKSWLRLILVFALLLLISIIIGDLLIIDLNWRYYQIAPLVEAIDSTSMTQSDMNLITESFILSYLIPLIPSILGAIFTALAMGITAIRLYREYKGHNGKLIEGLKSSFNKNILIILILFGLIVPLGAILVYIPSIIILGFYVLIFFTYRDTSIESPLKEARNFSRGNFWKIIGIFFISALIPYSLNIIYQSIFGIFLNFDTATVISWYNPATRNYLMIFFADIFYYQLMSIIFSPLFICLLTPLYTSLKARKQLGYSYQKDSYTMQQHYTELSTSSTETQEDLYPHKDEDFFCPFCGFHMPKKIKYCPNCGESLDLES